MIMSLSIYQSKLIAAVTFWTWMLSATTMPYFSLVDFDPIESSPLIMNHHEILIQIQSYQTMFTFLIDSGLLAAGRECDY